MKSSIYKIQFLFMVFLASSFLIAQTPEKPQSEKKAGLGFEGMLGFSFNDKAIAFNVGGPSLKFRMKDNFKIGFGAFPSMIILHEKVYPRLAFSPIIEYKKWLLTAPYYGYDTDDKMIWTFGAGYKFL